MSSWELFSSLNLISTQPEQQNDIDDDDFQIGGVEVSTGSSSIGERKAHVGHVKTTNGHIVNAIPNTDRGFLNSQCHTQSNGDFIYELSAKVDNDNVTGCYQHNMELECSPTGDCVGSFSNSRCVVDSSKALPMETVISRLSSVIEEDVIDDMVAVESLHPTMISSANRLKFHVDVGEMSPSMFSTDEDAEAATSHQNLPSNNGSCEIDREAATHDADNDTGRCPDLLGLYCGVCKISFTREDNLIRHLILKTHWEKITYQNEVTAAALCTKHHNQLMRHAKFYCQCCNYSPVTHSGLLSHLKSQQHRELTSSLHGPLYCSACNFIEYEDDSLLDHFASSTHTKAAASGCSIKEKLSNIKCMKCTKILPSTNQFHRHMQNHQKAQPAGDEIKCRYCDFTGKKSAVSNHIVRSHCDVRAYHCYTCDKGFNYEFDLRKHYLTAKHFNNVLDSFKTELGFVNHGLKSQCGHTRMKCNFCPFVTTVLSQLQSHYVTHHEESCPLSEDAEAVIGSGLSSHDSKACCRFCSRAVRTLELSAHEVKHILQCLLETEWKDSDMCSCFICYQIVAVADIEDHVLTKHTTKSKTDAGGKTSAKKNSLPKTLASIVRHHCAVEGCGRSYKTKGDLTVHMANHKEKKFECEECEKRFTTRKQLKAHTNTHQPPVLFSCHYCDYKGKTRFHLSRHMRIHAGSRPYSCPYCEYSSTTVGNLRKHILSTKKHAGAAMYRCTVSGCDFSSQTTASLKHHLVQTHNLLDELVMVKSTENDWIEVLEGHPIIPVQSRTASH